MENKIDTSFIEKKLLDLWKKYQNDKNLMNKYIPLFYRPLYRADLVIIGLNPSFDLKWIRRMDKDTKLFSTDEEIIDAYKWNNNNEEMQLSLVKSLDSKHITNHQYYDDLRDFASKIGLTMEAIELFAFRKTKSKTFKKDLWRMRDHPFYKIQSETTYDILNLINPKIVLVANAFASKLIIDYWNEEISDFSNEIGSYYLTLENTKKIPIFFSGMLGRGVTDNYSKKRLVWHIKKILELNLQN